MPSSVNRVVDRLSFNVGTTRGVGDIQFLAGHGPGDDVYVTKKMLRGDSLGNDSYSNGGDWRGMDIVAKIVYRFRSM